MMHMNIQDSGSPPSGGSAGPPGPGLGIGGVGVQLPPLPPEFLQAVAHQITQQAMAAAASAATDGSFGPRLLELCNRGLFECLALNLHCLRGERGALGALISDRIRRLSADVPPSLVGWLTAVVGLRLQAVLEQMPVTPEQVLPYVRRLGEPPEPPPRQVRVGTPPSGVTLPFPV
ncbi:hypothetical protein HGM15179_020286 [Zosterops borbonicus]|uniref:Uncharacterized protein n=1 Tax=Zosterops borbonicus TaxID=364589 RepID=A0A8K1D915_9PASS|nr:hypothetical protein HGM15179_020286 [Zosterops borbonicus]